MRNGRLYKRLMLRLFLFTAFLLLLIFVVPALFSLFAPFIAAFLLGAILNKPISFIVKKVRVTRPFVSIILVLFVFSGFIAIFSWFIYKLITEATSLAQNISVFTEFLTNAYNSVMEQLEKILDRLPIETDDTINQITAAFNEWLQTMSSGLAVNILASTPDYAGRIGNMLLAVIIFLISAFFLTNDYPKYINALKKFEKRPAYIMLVNLKNNMKTALGGFLKSLLILAGICFLLMFTAFTIKGQNYAFLLALVVALMDFMPIVGSSAILVPWALVVFLSGDLFYAIFLLSLSFGYFIIRKILEPKIMGAQIGISPFAALLTTYLGLKLFGVIGFIFAPVLTIVIIRLVKTGIFDGTVNDIKELTGIISYTLKRTEGE